MRYGKAMASVGVSVGVGAAVFAVAVPASAVQRNWDGSSSNSWNNLFNWSGNDEPDNDDTAFIGNAPNNAVLLNGNTATIDGLTVTSGASLNSNGFRILVDNVPNDALTFIGDGSTLIVAEVTGSPSTSGLDTDRLTVGNGGFFGSISNSTIDDILTVNSGGTVASFGTILLGQNVNPNGDGLNNNGTITAGFLGAATLTLQRGNNKTFDLDGTSGNGVIRASADAFLGGVAAARLNINGPLTDDFDGDAFIGERDTMSFQFAWTNSGQLDFDGTDADPATLTGATMTLNDNTATPGGAAGDGEVNVNTGTAIVNAAISAIGGTWELDAGTTVNFNANTNFGANARLDVNAVNTTVNVNNTLIVQQAAFNFDGAGSTTWNVGDGDFLRIDGTFSDAFSSTLNMGSNSILTLNGNGTFDSLSTLDLNAGGITLNIGGDTTIDTDIDLDGDIGNNIININNSGASLTISANSENDADGFSGTINNRGSVTVLDANGPTGFTNEGTILFIDTGPDPTWDGVDLFNVEEFGDRGTLNGSGTFLSRVFNRDGGLIQPGTSATSGILDFDDLLRIDDAEVEIDLGGTTPGTQHDQITGQDLTLYQGSTLDLDLIGGYVPTLYQEHVIGQWVNIGGGTSIFNFIDGVVVPATGTGLAVTYDFLAEQILVQRAVLGDANLNGQVEQGDLDAVLQNWGKVTVNFGDAVSWVTGDMTGDGRVDQADLDFVLQNWGDTGAPGFGGFNTAQLPEPAAAAALLALGAGLRRRRA